MVDFALHYEEIEFDPAEVQVRPTASSWNVIDESLEFSRKAFRNGLKAAIWIGVIHFYGAYY